MQNPSREYQPGLCNIGPAEITRRKSIGLGGALFAVGYSFVGAVLFFPLFFKLLVFIPAVIAATGFVQVYYHFCVAFGLSNVFNFGDHVDTTTNVLEKKARELDRRQAWKLIIISVGLAILYTLISAFLI